jgi:hypothetical protein
MPNRPRQDVLEDLATSALEHLFAEAGWTAEKLAKDCGEDMLVRIFDAGKSSPLRFFVQSKATDNIARYLTRNRRTIAYPIGTNHNGYGSGSLWCLPSTTLRPRGPIGRPFILGMRVVETMTLAREERCACRAIKSAARKLLAEIFSAAPKNDDQIL